MHPDAGERNFFCANLTDSRNFQNIGEVGFSLLTTLEQALNSSKLR
jgi:hypothetical protein